MGELAVKGKLDKTIPLGMKRCPRCGRPKILDEFSKATKSRDGRFTYCRLCLKEKNATRTSELRKKWYLAQKYGMTLSEYARMLNSQQGKCAICKQGKDGIDMDGKPLALDHSHKTGKARALLCFRCNVLLVLVEERSDLIPVMQEYLTLHM